MKKVLLLAMTVLLVVGLTIAGCAQPVPPTTTPATTTPPATLKPTPTPEKVVEVTVGNMRDYTGPISAGALAGWHGYDWYRQWLEQNDPIPGVKVKDIWEDTAYSAERYLPVYKKFKDAGAVLMINTSSTANSVLGELHRADKIPALTPGCGYVYGYFPQDIKGKGPSYLFYDRPPYPDCFATGAMYFLKKWHEAGFKEKPKAVFTGWDSAYCRGPIAATPYLTEQGFEMLPPQIYPVTATDLSTQVLAMKRAGANLIMSNVTEKFFAMLLKEVRKAGMEIGIGPGKVIVMGGSEVPNKTALDMAGEAGEGAWAVVGYPDFSRDDLKCVKLIKEFQMKNLGKIDENANYFMGMVYAQQLWDVLKKIVAKYGKENITSANIYKTLTELRDLDMIGLAPNISYGEYERRPFKQYLIHTAKGGLWRQLTPEYIDMVQLIPQWEEAGLPGYKVKM